MTYVASHCWFVNRAWCVGVLAAVAGTAPAAGGENPGKRPSATTAVKGEVEARPPLVNPVAQLACDPTVREELKLNERQTAAIDEAFAKIEEPMWLARDAVVGPAAAQRAALVDAFANDLKPILDEPQRARLRQLVVRAQGWPALTTKEISLSLKLSAVQAHRIDEIVQKTRREIQKAAADHGDSTAALRKREGAAIRKLLSADQRTSLAELVGPGYDLSRVRPLEFSAPRLKQVDAWIGSPPLALADLNGKVVAFHFWAFGCINCVHNLPHYNAWHERLAKRGLVVLGMHTPETQAERVPATLEQKVEEFAIRYPVAADHENQNWAAWGNTMWPSVYLIDKRGRVRTWWYGEMNWQGAEGEKFMREKIEELLAEGD